MPLYIEKVEIWSGVTDLKQTNRQGKIEQLKLLRSTSGALVTQYVTFL